MWTVALFVLTILVLPQICTGAQCLACHDIVEPTDCGVVINCGIHQQCYVDNYVTASGHVRYNLGCRDALQCGQADQADYPNSLVDKRSSGILICSECCQGPLCNSAGCGRQGYSALRGPVCYNCPDQLEVDDCETITVCGRDEVCLISQVPNPVNHEKRYQTRCELNQACYEEVNMVKGIQTLNQWNVDTCYIDCCTDDLCNSKCNNSNTVSATVSMTTTSTNAVHHCQSNPCNSGTCAKYGDTYICTCNVGAWGRNCENDLITNPPDMCSNNPCTHGNCSVVSSSYICDCETGYTGRNCENSLAQSPTTATTPTTVSTVPTANMTTLPGTTTQALTTTLTNFCVPNPCVNGECHANNSGYTCICSSGYFGDTCDHDVLVTTTTTTTTTTTAPNPCVPNPCVHGTCYHVNVHHFTCHCYSHNYIGHLCDHLRTTTTTTTTTTPRPDPCHLHHCVHGTCHHANNDLGYTCNCYNHYTGALCDKSVTRTSTTTTTTTSTPSASCHKLQCEHGGHCRVLNNQAVCLCTPDRDGQHCEPSGAECNGCGIRALCGSAHYRIQRRKKYRYEYTRHCEHAHNIHKLTIPHHQLTTHLSLVPQVMTHGDALKYCRDHCLGSLVVIRSFEKYQLLQNILVKSADEHADFWVDGKWSDQHKHWETSDGDRMTEQSDAWNDIHSWGTGGHCLRLRRSVHFLLDDRVCNSQFGLICEYDL